MRSFRETGERITLETRAGVIPVEAQGDLWTLDANAPEHREPETSREALAAMLRIEPHEILDRPLWVDTGSDQLVIPLASRDAVRRVAPKPDVMLRIASNESRAMAYVFAREHDSVLARYFFLQHGALIEDPGTGSACANLSGWLLVTGAALPLRLTVDQGEAVGRRCRLGLEVTTDRRIRVSGRVVELARGTLTL